ncbi:MAG: hypothetical protein M3176_00500 [Chloroflexota bacterium]|nr:hypothetical protein [Chloroflexota bacterium]
MTGGDEIHPADWLIHDLIAHPRTATEEETRLITDRIASAPFNPDIQRVQRYERGRKYQAITLGSQADSLTLHLFRRVMGDSQWAAGTMAEDYVQSLQRAARDSRNRLVLYRQWYDRDLAAVIVPTGNVLAPKQIGTKPEPNLLVLYLANRGILISGYQFSSMDTIRIPGDALWLR